VLTVTSLILVMSIIIFSRVEVDGQSDFLNNNFDSETATNSNRMLEPVVKLSMVIIPPYASGASPSEGLLLGSATGFSIKYNSENDTSYLITNDHFCVNFMQSRNAVMIVENSDRPRISPSSGEFMTGQIVFSDSTKDLCLVQVRGFIRPAKLADRGYTARQFEEITVVGAPTGTFPIITESYISGNLSRDEVGLGSMTETGNDFLFLSAMIFPGHSGSPVYNSNREVIGVVFAALPTYGSIAIPINDLYEFLDEL